MPLVLRPYAAADREAVLAVWEAASRVGHPFLSDADIAGQRSLVAEVYLPRAETLVAEEEQGGGIVGFIGLLDALVGGLFVSPDRHGTGIGRRLIEHAAALKGALTVEVYAANVGAPEFYRAVGFVEIGRKPQDDEGRPLDLIVMQRAA